MKHNSFIKDLGFIINYYSLEKGSDTPDYILAEYLISCLKAFDIAKNRSKNHDNPDSN